MPQSAVPPNHHQARSSRLQCGRVLRCNRSVFSILFLVLYGTLELLHTVYPPQLVKYSSLSSSSSSRRTTGRTSANGPDNDDGDDALVLPPTPTPPPLGTSTATESNSESGEVQEEEDDDEDSSSTSTRRPKFILHVGIPKTGTTFLQCALCSQAKATEPVLLKDSWIFLGTCPYESCDMRKRPKQFLKHSPSSFIRKTTLNPSFTRKVKQLRKQKRNVLVIFEGLHRLVDGEIRTLASFLTSDDWDVQVLVAYRPLYQWLPSKYNSQTKRMEALYEWPGRPIPHTDRVGEHWQPFDFRYPGNGGILRGLLNRINETQQHHAETVLHKYAAHFNASAIIPLHNLPPAPDSGVDPLLNYLFCVLWRDSSPRVCAAVRARTIGSNIPSNPSAPINYDMLATAAYEAGIIDTSKPKLDRRRVGRSIRHRQERDLKRTAKDFPLVCLPNRTLDELKNLSWKLEQSLFPYANEEEARRKHDNGFAKSVASRTYCWIDTNRTLSDPSWRSFLETGL